MWTPEARLLGLNEFLRSSSWPFMKSFAGCIASDQQAMGWRGRFSSFSIHSKPEFGGQNRGSRRIYQGSIVPGALKECDFSVIWICWLINLTRDFMAENTSGRIGIRIILCLTSPGVLVQREYELRFLSLDFFTCGRSSFLVTHQQRTQFYTTSDVKLNQYLIYSLRVGSLLASLSRRKSTSVELTMRGLRRRLSSSLLFSAALLVRIKLKAIIPAF